MNTKLLFINRLIYLFSVVLIFFSINVSAQYNFKSVEKVRLQSSTQSIEKQSVKDPTFTVNSIRVHQLNQRAYEPEVPFSTEGMLIFNYTSTAPKYLIIGAERTGTGFTYITQNLYAVPNEDDTTSSLYNIVNIGIRFDMQPLGITDGMPWPASTPIRIYFHFSDQASAYPGPNFYQYDLPVTPMDDDASNEFFDSTGSQPPIVEGDPPPNLTSPVAIETHIGFNMPNIDLDNPSHPAGPGYSGDWHACGPAAASNSMMWLAQNFEGISIPFSHRDLLDSLSRLMGRQQAYSGVSLTTMIQGKLKFIKTHNLPIQVKFQGFGITGDIGITGGMNAKNKNTGIFPSWEFLKKEIADSEDVELIYKWREDDKEKGHVVAVTGVYETDSQKKTIGIKHDVTQKDTGGTVQEFPEITVDSYNRMILHWIGKKRYVTGIISESPGNPFTSVEDVGENYPQEFYLEQNYPNPFNPNTKIRYTIPAGGKHNKTSQAYAVLKIYNILGSEIATLVNEEKQQGVYEVSWNASNLPSGVYFYRLQVGTLAQTKKMILLR